MESIPLTKAKARLSGLVGRLIHKKVQIVITRHGKPVAALLPYEDWVRSRTEAAGGLAAVAPPSVDRDEDIEAMISEIYEARAKSRARKPAV